VNEEFHERRNTDKQIYELEKRLIRTIEKHLKDAFPNGDLHGHRKSHEVIMKEKERKQNLRHSFLKSIINGAAVTTIGIAITLLWDNIKNWKIK
jgi:hypothetical protein